MKRPQKMGCVAGTALGLVMAGCGGSAAAGFRPGESMQRVGLEGVVPAAAPLAGVTIHPGTGHLVVLAPGHGLVELDAEGNVLGTLLFREHGLPGIDATAAYTDLAALADGTYALASDTGVDRYDPASGVVSPYFCVVPEGPTELPVNHAVTLDGNTVLAAPARLNTQQRTLTSAWHSEYRALDGAFSKSVNVTASGVVAEGMAVDPRTRDRVVVEGSRAHVFREAAQVGGPLQLSGMEQAVGVALDAERARIWVLDGADRELRAYTLWNWMREEPASNPFAWPSR